MNKCVGSQTEEVYEKEIEIEIYDPANKLFLARPRAMTA